MKILAVDTTGEPLSLALGVGDKVFAFHRKLAAPHDETLLPRVDRLLARASLKLEDLDAIAAASGPGRFTGIRIGMAYAAVAASALKVPAIAVSRFEAAAWKIPRGSGCCVLPGWREEKFYQVFRGTRAAGPPVWADPKFWLETLAELKKRGVVVAELDPTAADLLAPAARYVRRKTRPSFAPLYLKPAGYEANHPTRQSR